MANKISTNTTSNVVINSDESGNIADVNEQKQADDVQKLSKSVGETKKINKESTDEAPTDEQKTHIVTYIGSGIWSDSTGSIWSREPINGTSIKNERRYSNKEYDAREDLKFMVSYGEMKLITV